MKKNVHIVCLGGGIGTSSVLRGLKRYDVSFTVITSMADDGGSSGRLRKAYDIMPPGDIINSIAALIPDTEKELASLLLYRFPGSDTSDNTIDGQKLGNLIMLAELQRTGDFNKAIATTRKMFHVTAVLLPATEERVQLSAITKDGRHIHTETTLDLALYSEPHGLKNIYLTPENPKVNQKVIESIMSADVIISGPGDLYTNQLPVLIVPEIKNALIQSKAQKIFILNIANKPFETKGFTLDNFTAAITDHIGIFPFNIVIANDNLTTPIPQEYKYEYILSSAYKEKNLPFKLITADVVNEAFPLYHDPGKLASIISNSI